MRILVTGGAGFIGEKLVNRYRWDGHQVYILDRSSGGDLSESGRFIKDFQPEIVSHHAANCSVARSIEDPLTDAQNNLIGTISLLEACVRNGVKKVIFASTGGAVYGEGRFFLTHDNERSYLPNKPNVSPEPISPYGINKLACELYLGFYKQVHGLKYVCLRYGNVYGRGCHGVIPRWIEAMRQGMPVEIRGSGYSTRDYVYIDDVVQANVDALEDNIEGIYNVGTGVETSLNDLAALLSELTQKPYSVKSLPEIKGEVRRNCLTPSKIQKKITPLRDGLREMVS